MRTCIAVILFVLVSFTPSFGGDLQFTNAIKATLRFQEQSPSVYYPHLIHVFLCLENVHDSDVTWMCDCREDIEAELFDSKGKPVEEPPSAASIMSNAFAYRLPYGSKLEWLISLDGGISMSGDKQKNYALIIGDRGWLIPTNAVLSYSLRVRVKGQPWDDISRNYSSSIKPQKKTESILFDLPPTPIVIK